MKKTKGPKIELVKYGSKPICIMVKNARYNGIEVADYLSPDEGASSVGEITLKEAIRLLGGR